MKVYRQFTCACCKRTVGASTCPEVMDAEFYRVYGHAPEDTPESDEIVSTCDDCWAFLNRALGRTST